MAAEGRVPREACHLRGDLIFSFDALSSLPLRSCEMGTRCEDHN
jgi:hypothetical protein